MSPHVVRRLAGSRAKALAQEPSEPAVKGSHIASDRCLPSGITLLNLALSGRASGGYPLGFIYHKVGDSDTMKTLSLLSAENQAAKLERFAKYKLIHDDIEEASCWDMPRMFSQELADRIQSPCEDGNSFFLEDFYKNVYDLLKANTQFIYGCDSMDSLDPMEDVELFEANNKAREAGKDEAKDFGTKKARLNSRHLRKVKGMLRKTDSILFIISQTRENINAGPFGQKNIYSGGKAIKFYAAAQIWFAPRGAISKKIQGKNRKVGTLVTVKVEKNHLTGRKITFTVPVFYSRGIDDIACCVEWLVEEKFWKGGVKMNFGKYPFPFNGSKKEVIKAVRHDKDLQKKLRHVMQKAWDDLDKALKDDEDAEVGDDCPETSNEE